MPAIASQDLGIEFDPPCRYRTLAELQIWENYGVIISRIRRAKGRKSSPVWQDCSWKWGMACTWSATARKCRNCVRLAGRGYP